MKHKLLIAAAASALMAAPSLAQADDHEGWYLRGNVGYGTHTDMDIVPDNTLFTGGLIGDVESEGNVAGSLGAGYDFGNNWRLEVDGASMWSDMGAIAQHPASFAKVRTTSLMLNAIYDFNDFGRWEPYVGAGLGYVKGDVDAVAHDFVNNAGTVLINTPACNVPRSTGQALTCEIHDGAGSFGWQLLAGLGYDITDKLTWDTHYRYQDAGNMEFNGTATDVVTGNSSSFQSKFEDMGAHMLMTGFRYKFGDKVMAPPPPPPPPAPVADFRCWDGSMVFNAGQCPAEPAPAQPEVRCWDGSMVFEAGQCPAQPQTYTCWDGSVVSDLSICPPETRSGVSTAVLCGEQYRSEVIYYEFDKGQSAETRNTINRILDTGQFCDVDNIRVVGHTDTSGSAAYNLSLSKRRAKDAVDELVRQGIDRNKISSEGKGETEPIIPGDNRKEQLNRRTEVLITLGSIGAIN